MLDTGDRLTAMLTRLKLTAIRDGLDSLLDEAAHGELTLRESLALLCEREIARKDSRRIEMAIGLARFPYARDLAGFDFSAQPSIDRGQIRDLASGRFVGNGETLNCQRRRNIGAPGGVKLGQLVAAA
jgi:DNA replication protein DnaC